MCFSARFSFIAAGLLATIALASYRKVRNRNEIPFASIPLAFGAQQALEGALWILLPNHADPTLILLCLYGYLGCALVFWPLFIPLALILLEHTPLRRAIMGFCLILGSTWSVVSLWHLIQKGAEVQIQEHHIVYTLPGFEGMQGLYLLVLYCMIVLIPFLASSDRYVRLIGCFMGASCIVSYLVWYYYFTSVWCFFAALVSLGIYGALDHRHRKAIPKHGAS